MEVTDSMDINYKNLINDNIKIVAQKEKLPIEFIQKSYESGEIVIPNNLNRSIKCLSGIGNGLSTKVNANIGTSPDYSLFDEELEKLNLSVKAGADAVMDLSTGEDLRKIRKAILDMSPLPVGTVPVYQVACETRKKGKEISQMEVEHIFAVIEEQAQEGVDFMTLHCGVTKETLTVLKRQKRLGGIVSRGGAFFARWIDANDKENPLYECYDRLLDIAKKYNVTLSLGDGLRPGCLADASDGAQIAELSVLGELVVRARKAGVQAMVEGPGHMPLDQIAAHVHLAKRLIHNAPYYLLGPLVTDVAAGYDHITSAIGGAVAAAAGADFLCYVTPAEHLRLPEASDVYKGVIASKIAAHAADISKGIRDSRKWDDEFSRYRKALNWDKQQELALDPDRFKAEREKRLPKENDFCTMCGRYCAIKEEK